MSTTTLLDRAANSFMLIQVSMGRYDGEKKVPDNILTKYAESTGTNVASLSGKVKVLGRNHSALAAVIAAFAAIRTYLYENTLPFSQAQGDAQSRGDRLIPVPRVPEVLTRLGELKHIAETTLTEFLVEYPRYVREAVAKDLGTLGGYISHPSAEEVRAKFHANISPPKAIPVMDMKRFGSLPAGLAQQIADANGDLLARQLTAAKNAAMQQAEDHIAVVVKQLTDGQRLSASLIDNARHHAQLLREMVQGYDNDPRLLTLADLIDEKISSVPNVEVWKESPTKKAESLRAAETVVKGLKAVRTAKPVAPVVQPVRPGGQQIAGDGLIADLLN